MRRDFTKVTALVAAGGSGARMRSGVAKPWIRLNGRPIILYTLKALHAHPLIDEIVLVLGRDGLKKANELVRKFRLTKVAQIVAGGATRRGSVENGLKALRSGSGLVLIHDGARPLVGPEDITRVIEMARRTHAAILGVPVKATVKKVDGRGAVKETPDRDSLWEIQTPQVFERRLIERAHRQSRKGAAFDDASLVEQAGHKVWVVPGSYGNIKITTPEDLVFAQAALRSKRKNV
jgi:2-C-methyl-D-erythritol 4-phosphate cytidylyltransferase